MKIKVLITGGSGFIGTNLLQYYIERNIDVLNIDIKEPRNPIHITYWKKTDILNKLALTKIFQTYKPTHVVHLAAKTDLRGKNLDDYKTNTIGVKNILKVMKTVPSLRKVIFASSMLVCKSGYIPKNSNDYNPNTTYGRSKVEAEHIIKNEFPREYKWNIVRPTSIWGPWFSEPYKNFFCTILKNKFYHPGKKAATKTYGFVLNTVYQINYLLFSENENINKKMYYIGDKPPINISEWANEIRFYLNRKPAKELPYSIFIILAKTGDILSKFSIKFPMTSFRLKNMTTNNIVDLDELYATVGTPPYNREEGIKITLEWLLKNEKNETKCL